MASGGHIENTVADSTHIAGTYDVTFLHGELSGCFDVSHCSF